MSQNLIIGLPTPIALGLFGLMLMLLALAGLAVVLRRPARVRIASHYDEAPYKIETPGSLAAGRVDVVAHAGRAPANR